MAESEELLEAKAKSLTSQQLAAELDNKQQQEVEEEKVSLRVGLEDDRDDGEADEWSSCSDRSFDTGSIEIRARSNSCGSQTSMVKDGIKKPRKRRQKGGSRHRRHQKYQFGKDIELEELSQKALYLKQKDNAAALRRLEGEEELVYSAAAPFNSSQYIMEEFDKNFPHTPWDSSRSASSSPPDKTNSVPLTPVESHHAVINCVKEDQEFTESLISAQAECLQSLPKDELVKNFINLEEKVADLHKQVAQGELKQKQEQDEEDVYSPPECGHVNDPYVCESVFNSETNSLSSNNEEYVDLSGVNRQPVCVDESSVFVSDDTVPPPDTNVNSSGCAS